MKIKHAKAGSGASPGVLYDGLLVAALLSAVLVAMVFYHALNRTSVAEVGPLTENDERLESYVDDCELKDGTAYIDGWMLLRGQTRNTLMQAYVENREGEWVALNTRLVEKRSAYHHYGLDYSRSRVGFSAAGRVKNVAPDARFLVVKTMLDENNYGIYHVCQTR